MAEGFAVGLEGGYGGGVVEGVAEEFFVKGFVEGVGVGEAGVMELVEEAHGGGEEGLFFELDQVEPFPCFFPP